MAFAHNLSFAPMFEKRDCDIILCANRLECRGGQVTEGSQQEAARTDW